MAIQTIFFYTVLGILVLIAGVGFFRREWLKKSASRFFLYSSGLVFSYLIYISFLQFRAFQNGPLNSILGTKKGILWFFTYAQIHFWNAYLVSLIFSVIFLIIVYYFNQKYNERFFEKEELYLTALGILLTGYPGCLFYFILMLLIPTIILAVFLKKGERLPLYYFWLPIALVIFLAVNFWAQNQPWWTSFRFGFLIK